MKKKVLLMGKSGSGKTSMRSIIFANFVARDTNRLSPTLDVEHNDVRLFGGLVLNLWDCGGQDSFYENYFQSQRNHIFSNVELLIYVFDVESRQMAEDLQYFENTLKAIEDFSEDAHVFVLVHKMDLIDDVRERDAIFKEREELIMSRTGGLRTSCYPTSIWDESLYKAWSVMVHSLIPNVHLIEDHLNDFCTACDASEVVLFERATLLAISHVTHKDQRDDQRFEKISNIIKQFKLVCHASQTQMQAMEVRNSRFTAFVDIFTASTSIMVITAGGPNGPTPTAVNMNIARARTHFETDKKLVF